MDEKRAFGLTLEEVAEVKRSVADWKDINSPLKKKSDGGTFATAFREGSKLLRSDKTFLDVFDIS